MRVLLQVGLLLAGSASLAGGFLCPPTRPLQNRQHLQQQQQRPHQSLLLQVKTSHSDNNNNNDDDTKEPEPVLPAAYISKRRCRFRKFTVSLALATSLWSARSLQASAKYSHELSETPTTSLRPGMNKNQADLVEAGELDMADVEHDNNGGGGSSSGAFGTKADKKAAAVAKQKSQFVDQDDEDDEDDDDEFYQDDVIGSSSSTVGRQSDQAAALALEKRTTDQFASYKQVKSSSTKIKVAAVLFVPTFGGMFLREFLRRRREEVYVIKGLEILEAQKAEYFNVTAGSDDADVSDELKDLKDKDDEDDDDDDDDEDDDDEDDDDEDDEDDKPPSRSKPKPKKPRGDGGGGGGDTGDGAPSDDDLDKLNKMFRRS